MLNLQIKLRDAPISHFEGKLFLHIFQAWSSFQKITLDP